MILTIIGYIIFFAVFFLALALILSVFMDDLGFFDRAKSKKPVMLTHKQKEEIQRKAKIIKLEKELGLPQSEFLTTEEQQALLIIESWK
jgi:hypothetical protein